MVINGSFQWFTWVKREWVETRKHKRNQEFKKIFFQFIQQDVQSGGYRGWRSSDVGLPLYKNYSDYTEAYRYFRFDQTIFGFTATPGHCYGKMPKTACERMKDNAHVLVIYNVPKGFAKLKYNLPDLNAPLITETATDIQEKSLVLISDLDQGDLFIATHIAGNTLQHKKILGMNSQSELSKCYALGTEVVELQTVAYYLGTPERLKQDIHSVGGLKSAVGLKKNRSTTNFGRNQMRKTEKVKHYSLFRDDFLHPAQELISEIQELNFLYGVEETSEIRYLNAIEIRNWSEVKSVRIQVTMANGACWQTDISLRNRIGVADRIVGPPGHVLVYHTDGARGR